MNTDRVNRFYRVLVVGAASLTGACGDGETIVGRETPDADAGPADANQSAADASAPDAGAASDCCPLICGQMPCVCQGEEIPCCWLVPHPLCENLCDS